MNFIKNTNFFDFKDKIIYVVGGSGLIGIEIVKDLLKYNAKIIILDLNKPKNINLQKQDQIFFQKFNCNSISEKDFNITNFFKKYGDPYALINCSYPRDKNWVKNNFSEMKTSSFKKNLELHLISYAIIAKDTANYMAKKKIQGSILLFSSIYGFLGQDLSLYKRTSMRENFTYSVIKGGITNVSRQMCSYYGRFNIRINTISPGGLYGHIAGKNKIQNKIFIDNYSKKTPLSRMGRSSEISKSAIFLISSKASYISGINLVVDGGISLN